MFNVQFLKTYGLQEANYLAAVILIYKVSAPFNSNYSKRLCVLLMGPSHPTWKQFPKTFLWSTTNETQLCQGQTEWGVLKTVTWKKVKKTVDEYEWELGNLDSSLSLFTNDLDNPG